MKHHVWSCRRCGCTPDMHSIRVSVIRVRRNGRVLTFKQHSFQLPSEDS